MNNIAYLSLGSNIGDRISYLNGAIRDLEETHQIQIVKKSSIYETDPVGYTDQDLFLNMVLKITTDLTPYQLLSLLQQIENKMERKREIRWGPRTLDLDILLFNDENIETEQLTIPHPRMYERSFVLVPLLEIEPNLTFPQRTESLVHLIDQLRDKEGVRIWKQKSGEEEFALLES
ncbi:2-amino-4-hydroxy-6-hydroxymethyldihydropteridine diphosphokinase [Bacillus sp. FJAT-47783]|uniref:2-amino-4-hydroxy-6- hydroxymethyldihydropteridine diphosphokinase n=1 Tax=Bacillus sp. FJAT-47783 TaxID=2922712 RepID=UPI001FACC361|nr:2-amino-4-hydroxy-6-hydroxymethyldihydropteridine diphosphokinase [Bacillus sp. FJAT-47783]